ncbi:MAG: leucine--tRNA ligase [Deltaproteobacteria bacterium]|nr:leucine--tRNA ligase [Deltaproteobacteria bacterium]
MSEKYDPKAIEGKWQWTWEQGKVFEAKDPSEDPKKRPKFYCLCMFPYPSGAIHMGHVRNYSIGDCISRYKRMRGFNVLQPIGWDAFGLPAENAAISRGVHPKEWTILNIAQMKKELRSIGIGYDWNRELTTCLPDYYRWEQQLFNRFFREGLAYKKKSLVNWCSSCETVLANEQVQDGKCWRCDSEVGTKEVSQWYLKITLYADQLLAGHEQLRGLWPERVLEMQKHWIGRSEGCRILFPLEKKKESSANIPIEVFTTRPDTLFGVTFLTLAPAHPLADHLCTGDEQKKQLEELKKEVARRNPGEEATTKTGFFTGSYCIHPLGNQRVPIWVGNFVVMEYGTGAVMGVPAHDQRDFEFAKQHGLPIRTVVVPKSKKLNEPLTEAYVESGELVDSGPFSGQDSESSKRQIAEALKKKNLGNLTIQYKLRDWGISRQRYWGAPVPIIYCAKCGTVPVPEEDLPVTLPENVSFTGKGGNPLDQATDFVNTVCPRCNEPARRETDTMDTFVESSWYYARFASPHYDKGPFDRKKTDQWLPVDCYIGGIEHACMHLLYARFFHKVLRDWEYLSGDEPFARQFSQGMVVKDGAKMSKSKGNVVTPASIIDRFGADTARLFSLFAAPPEKDLDWNDKGVEGCHRFLQRLWRLFYPFRDIFSRPLPSENELHFDDRLLKVRRKTHWMIRKMTDDLEAEKFNTAISAAMELVNEVYGLLSEDEKAFTAPSGNFVLHEALQSLVVCLAPFSPHICEELWAAMGHKGLIADAVWPGFRADLIAVDTFLLVVQVNGKVRDRVEVTKQATQQEIEKLALALPKIVSHIQGKKVRQVVYVPGRLANIVVA